MQSCRKQKLFIPTLQKGYHHRGREENKGTRKQLWHKEVKQANGNMIKLP
jgi:hypothetical protein